MTARLTPEREAEIAAAVSAYQAHPNVGFACCSAHPAADAAPELMTELAAVRARVAELEAERHSTNEALDDAMRALQENRNRIHELETQLADTIVEAYPGELARYRTLVRALRAEVRGDNADINRVRRLLLQHAADDATARAKAGASPVGPTGRVARLLDAIRTEGGRWTTSRAARFYLANRLGPPGAKEPRIRTVARGDLRDLAAWGYLVRHEEPGRQYYVERKDRS